MKKHLFNALVAVSLLATLNSCSKDQGVEPIEKGIKQTNLNDEDPFYHPLDPNQYGYISQPENAIYYYNDSVTAFFQAQNTRYMSFKALSLEKYKNGELLDSICNQDLALKFEVKARKYHNKDVKWGSKPLVSDEFAPTITFTMGNTMTIKFSKMVTGFGFEFNSLFRDGEYGVTTRYRNSKLNKKVPPTYTSYIRENTSLNIKFGMPGGAIIRAIESQTPFDEVSITFETGFKAPTLNPPYDISLAGFRYKLAK